VRLPAHCGRRLALAATLAISAALVAACSDVPTDPALVFSLSVDSAPSPSVVAGDSLRDTNGVVAPLKGHAFNLQGTLLSNVQVRFTSLTPSQLTINTSNIAIGARGGDSVSRIVATAQSLQSLPFLLPVVLRPDSILHADSDSISSIALALTSLDTTSAPLNIVLRHIPDSLGGDSVTRTYIVHYQIIYPASAAKGTGTPSDTTLFAYLVDASGNPSRTDTTDVNGLGTRSIFIKGANVSPTANDSIVAVATAMYRKTPVGNSPLRFVVHYMGPNFKANKIRTSAVSPCTGRPCYGHN
jgi:hypothetical protein